MSLVKDAGLEKLASTLGCKLKQTDALLTRSLNRVEHLHPSGFSMRTQAIAKFKEHATDLCANWDAQFQELATLEEELTAFVQPASKDTQDLQKDALGQLSFQDEYFKSLNLLPFALLLTSLFKVWAVPLMAILSPLLTWILPYIFLKFFYKLPISSDQYSSILQMVWSGSPVQFAVGADGRPTVKPPSMFTPRSLVQTLMFGAAFLQSLIQPIQNAYHLYKTDKTIYTNGERAIRLFHLYKHYTGTAEAMGLNLKFRESLDDMDTEDPRRAIHLLLDQPERLRIAFRDLADVEILWRMSQSSRLCPAQVMEKGAHPFFQAIGMRDISLDPSIAVPSDIYFTGTASHAALTGPNGGGKSSFLRGFLQSILLAQAYGVAPAERVLLRRFGWISSGLRLQDAPGEMSMFETEVWFAARLLERASERGPGLVLYDELFHSTNPPDGIETARIFLERLWERQDVVSIVSTHVFDLVEAAPKNVQRVCCQAEMDARGVLRYGYALEKGICRLSSVRSIWDRFGLARVRTPTRVKNLFAEKK